MASESPWAELRAPYLRAAHPALPSHVAPGSGLGEAGAVPGSGQRPPRCRCKPVRASPCPDCQGSRPWEPCRGQGEHLQLVLAWTPPAPCPPHEHRRCGVHSAASWRQNVGVLCFPRGIPCCVVTRGFPGDAALWAQPLRRQRGEEELACFATKNGARLRVPRVPGAGLARGGGGFAGLLGLCALPPPSCLQELSRTSTPRPPGAQTPVQEGLGHSRLALPGWKLPPGSLLPLSLLF